MYWVVRWQTGGGIEFGFGATSTESVTEFMKEAAQPSFHGVGHTNSFVWLKCINVTPYPVQCGFCDNGCMAKSQGPHIIN